jgi:tetratricopeptide (TPR) repeat protein
VKRKSKKHHSVVLALVCLVLVLGLFFRSQIAWGLVLSGNEFFGGHLPYNLSVADGFYQAALVVDSQVNDAWHQRARIAFLRGDFGIALKRINTQIALHGDSFMASYYIRGLIYGYAHNYPAAEKDFSHFLTWSPHNWAANNDLAWIYFAQGKFKAAAIQSQVGLDVVPGNAWLLVTHGMALYNLGDTTGAQRDLEQAKRSASVLTDDSWTYAYPGNDPAIAIAGLAAFKKTIDKDLELVHNGASPH